MIRCQWFNNDELQQGDASLIGKWKAEGGSLWVDLLAEDKVSERQLLKREFGISGLEIDDAQRDRHPPKLEQNGEFLFLIWRGLHPQTDSMDFRTIQIASWYAPNLLITRHQDDSRSIDNAWTSQLELPNANMEKVLYRILRNVVDRYTPVITDLEGRLEEIEDLIVSKPSDQLLAELLGYSRQLKKMRRILRYHENIAEQLYSDAVPEISLKHEFQDIYEQNERLASLSNMYHEIVVDLINGYLSVASHKLNQIMRVLTVVTVILAPLSVLVGIYGMNFDYIPELKFRYGYFILLGLMFSIVGGLCLWFRKRGWL